MPWVGFDFDGTLAREHTLEPVPLMLKRLQMYLDRGIECRILTARGNDPRGINLVKTWLKDHNLPDLEVTSKKDYQMIVLYDDRARQVLQNQGIVVGEDEPKRQGEIILPVKEIVHE
jgi:hypothetical protein